MKKESIREPAKTLSVIAELKRKSIHLGMIIIPVWIYFAPPSVANLGLIIATIATIVLDVLRLSDYRLKSFFLKFFKSLMRRHEEEHLLGSTYFMIAAVISVLVFDKMIAVSSLAFLVLGDTAAAVVGKRFGKLRYWGKSVEGSLACLTCCLAISYVLLDFQGGAHLVVVAGSAAATVAEALPAPMDDNMRVPIFSGLVMQMVAFFS